MTIKKEFKKGKYLRVILVGFKSSGKTTLGKRLSESLSIDFFDLDELLEKRFSQENGKAISFREIFRKIGEKEFRKLENVLLREYISLQSCLISLGGGTIDCEENRKLLEDCYVVYVRAPIEDIIGRINRKGFPSYLDGSDDPEKELRDLYLFREPVFEKIADIVIENPNSVKFEELILYSTRKILNLVQNNECN